MRKNLCLYIKEFREHIDRGRFHRLDIPGITIDIYPGVFPPISDFSESCKVILDVLEGRVLGKKVLDIGTGTGILAIKAALLGASSVDAIDICPVALECARHNVRLNELDERVRVFRSDLFSDVQGSYDLILGNLPILNWKRGHIVMVDPGFGIHKRLFCFLRDYLSKDGKLVISHANLQKNSFAEIENLGERQGYLPKVLIDRKVHDYVWRSYQFSR